MKKLIKSISVSVILVVSVLILPAKAFSQSRTAYFQADVPNGDLPSINIGSQSYTGNVYLSGRLIGNSEFFWDGDQGSVLLYNESKTLLNFTIVVYNFDGSNDGGIPFITAYIKDNDTGEVSDAFKLRLQE